MNPPSMGAVTAKEQSTRWRSRLRTQALFAWQAHAEQDRRALLQALGCARNLNSLGLSVFWPLLACKRTRGLGVDVCSLHLA